jgi:hypothetical protein
VQSKRNFWKSSKTKSTGSKFKPKNAKRALT